MQANPLLIPDTLALVLKYLDGASIKSARLVCSLWNLEATRLLFIHNYLRIPNSFHNVKAKNKAAAVKRWREWLSGHSGKIHNFSINYEAELSIFQELGMEHKEVEKIRYNLDSNSTLEKILEFCPNLNYLEGLNTGYKRLSMFIRFKKNSPFLISRLNLNSSSIKYLDKLVLFGESGIRVENLCLELRCYPFESPEIPQRHAQALERILYSSRDDLKLLQLNSASCFILKNVKIPRMTKLEYLRLEILPETHHAEFGQSYPVQFHPQFKFEQNFPNLKAIHFYIIKLGRKVAGEEAQAFWNDLFKSTGPAPQIKNFSIQNWSQIDMPKNLLSLFGSGSNKVKSIKFSPDECFISMKNA